MLRRMGKIGLALVLIIGLLPMMPLRGYASVPSFNEAADFGIEGPVTYTEGLNFSDAQGLQDGSTAVLMNKYVYQGNSYVSSNFLRIYSSTGTLVTDVNLGSLMDTYYKMINVSMLALNNGNLLITYGKSDSSENNTQLGTVTESTPNAYFMILNKAGQKVTGQTRLNTFSAASLPQLTRFISAAELSDGNIAFTWQRNDNKSTVTRVFTPAGSPVTGETLLIDANASMSYVAAGDGVYMTAYNSGPSNDNIYLKLFSNSGALLKTINVGPRTGEKQLYLSVLSNGNFMFSQFSWQTGTIAALYDNNGDSQGSFSVNGALSGAALYRKGAVPGFVTVSLDAASNQAIDDAYNYGTEWSGTQYAYLNYYDNDGNLVFTTDQPIDSGPVVFQGYDAENWVFDVEYYPRFAVYPAFDDKIVFIKTDNTDASHYRITGKLFNREAVVLTPVALQSAAADGTPGAVTSTKIDLTFDQAINGLTAEDITITDGTGSAVKGALSGAGTAWSIGLSSVTKEGDVSVAVNSPSGYTVSGSPLTANVSLFKPSPEATPAAVIDYAAEQLTGLAANGKYTINGTPVTADGAGELALDSSWLGTSLSIVKQGNASTTIDSAAQTLTVPSRPAAPVSVTATDETAINAQDGALVNVTNAMEYKRGTAGEWKDVAGTSVTGLVPDTYYVRVKATATAFASDMQSVAVEAYVAVPEATPAAVIDYAAEQLTGLAANGKYTINGTPVTADEAGELALDGSWLGTPLSIVKQGNASTTIDSAAQTLVVPSRPAAPVSVTATDETAINAQDGALVNVDSTMEYKRGTAGAWADVTGVTVTDLAPDTYYVRVKATATAFASDMQSVAVEAYVAVPEATPAAVIDYAAEQLTGLAANGKYTINGTPVTADEAGELALDGSWLGTPLSIVKQGNASTTIDSAAQTLTVPSRPAAPVSVTATDETAINAQDGALVNVINAMEYKRGTRGTWMDVTGVTVTGLAPDTYYVRVKATATAFASDMQSVAVEAYVAVPEVTPAAVIDYAAEQLTGLAANGKYTINGTPVTADEAGELALDSSWLGTSLSIVKQGNASTTIDSAAQTLTVPSRPAAPVSVTATDETAINAQDGALVNVINAMEYKRGTRGTWMDVTGVTVTGLAPDTYYVRVKATATAFASDMQSVAVEVYVAVPEATPAAVIDYAAEQLTGLAANGKYTINGTPVTADEAGELALDGSWLGTPLSIVKQGNASTTIDSAAQTLVVPSRPAAPVSVTATDETAINAQDGALVNVTTAMEYRRGNAGAWMSVSGPTVTDLAPDTYYVRVKATATAFASDMQSVAVEAYVAVPEITPAAVIDYTAEQLTGLIPNGKYVINGMLAATADVTGKLELDSSWLGVKLNIVKQGNASTTINSAAQTLDIPARPAAPAGVAATDETAINAHDGSLINVTPEMEYKRGAAGDWADVTGVAVTGLVPDMYYVRVKATDSAFASAPVSLAVTSFAANAEVTPEAVIDYAAEILTGLVPEASYTINGAVVTATAQGTLVISSEWLGTTLSIVKQGNGATTTDSAVQTLNLPARPAAPVGVSVTDVTYKGANDGTLQNLTVQMEYKTGSAGLWTDATDNTLIGLAPDTYYVRVKATDGAFASIAAQVTVHDSDAVIPAAPEVAADDLNNTITVLDTSMEFAVDDGPYVRYDGTNLPDLSGEHTVKVRVAASGSVPAGPATELAFTTNPPLPAAGLTVSASDPDGVANNGQTQITVTPAPAGGHKLLYMNFGAGSVMVPNVGDLLTGYTLVGSDGLIPAEAGDTLGIAEVDADGKVVKYGSVIAVVTASTPVTPGPDPVNPGSGTGNGSNPGSGTASGNTASNVTSVIVLVNGKEENAGTATTITSGNIRTTTIAVDPARLQAKLDAEGNGAVVTIPVMLDSNIIIGELNGQMIKNMEDKSATLVLQTGKGSYTLPASELNISALAARLGNGTKLEDITLKLTIGETSSSMSQIVTAAAGRGGFAVVAPSMDFSVTASSGSATVELDRFKAYVKRTVALPQGIDPNRVTTGIVVDPDGKVRHVPTRVIQQDGRYYAEISSLTNSTYSVVWHPLNFKDVEKHWAKNAVNDMGSRLVINGVNESTFNPNADITRAEFAAIMVRGLGLKLGGGTVKFADVPADSWYAAAVEAASREGLINGFEDGTFRPDARITREQAMNIIAKAMKLTGLAELTGTVDTEGVLAAFTDAGRAGAWAKDSLALAARAGLITGRGGSKLEATANVTRAEVAVLIQRLLQKSDLID
ncbi:S-layer homology domain-containing protein [Paenibacillus piscarius]|uniref:S-layer homology domain-containing protein n=1 Tax=Paenibacillus piscarius TaxID=1089681 RepID=UPI001EE7F98F|nr:S-layer homology domain-containing protein [Paenibacillus piscarius]